MTLNHKISPMISRARRKLVIRRFVRAIGMLLAATFFILAVLLVLRAVIGSLPAAAWATLAMPLLVVLLASWPWKIDDLELAKAIDVANDFSERLSSAIAFSKEDVQTPWMKALIADTEKRIERAETRDAMIKKTFPVEKPTHLKLAIIAALTAIMASVLPPVIVGLAGSKDGTNPIVDVGDATHLPDAPKFESNLDEATRALREEQAREMLEAADAFDDPELKEAAEELNQILEDDKEGKLSADAFQKRLEELQNKLAESDPAPQLEQDRLDQSLADALRELTDMKEDPETKPLADTLENKDYDKAADILRDLVNSTDPKDKQKLEKLAKMFGDLAQKLDMTDPELNEAIKKNKNLVDQLEKKLNQDGKLTDEEKKAFADAKKRLDEAQKQKQTQQSAPDGKSTQDMQKAFDKTAKDLKDKAQKGGKDQHSEPDDQKPGDQGMEKPGDQGMEKPGDQGMEKPAEQGQDGAGEQPSADEALKNEAKNRDNQQKRDQLKDLANKMKDDAERNNASNDEQSQADKQERAENMQDYLERAKGNEGTKSQTREENKNQQGQQQGEQGQQEGEQGQQQGEQDQQQGEQGQQQGEQGQQQGEQGQQQGQPKQGAQEMQQGGQAQQSEQGLQADKEGAIRKNEPSGGIQPDEQGGHYEDEGPATQMNVNAVDQALKGQASSAPTTSEVIQTASQSGFVHESYREVYQSYEHAAEEVLESEEVPQGYRHYVEKYFDMIRPQN